MKQLIVKYESKSPISETYRTLRTNIQFTALDSDEKTLLVTSAGKGEGKSTTIANLAVAIAETDKKILLIDCDMRRPTMHKVFKISNLKGVSNYLIGQVPLEEVVHSTMPFLDIIPSGTIPPNPSELLGSKKMKRFLDQMKKQYEYILIDAPPVMAVTDAQVLSTLSNGVILVVASGKAERELAKRSKELLESVGATIVGAVLTCVDMNDRYQYGYYNYFQEEPKVKRGLFNRKKKS